MEQFITLFFTTLLVFLLHKLFAYVWDRVFGKNKRTRREKR